MRKTSRRRFLCRAALAGAGLAAGPAILSGRAAVNGKMKVGFVGVANRAKANLEAVAAVKDHVQVTALCDVDDHYLAAAKAAHPGATPYRDFRKMIEKEKLDAVVVSTPDHTHAMPTALALQAGAHVYCEKPLTRTVSESRVVTELARQHNRVTQIGTQIHADNNYRRVVELVRAGAIGDIRRIHVWLGSGRGGKTRSGQKFAAPPHLDYRLWLGPMPYTPYQPDYVPMDWRDWWHFGGGTLADFGCHFMDLPYWALDLKYPLTIHATGPDPLPHSAPLHLKVDYQFPARGKLPPIHLTWYHGQKPDGVVPKAVLDRYGNGVLFVGSEGQLIADYGKYHLLPEKKFAGFGNPDPTIPRSIGHHREWVMACLGEGKTTCPFSYSGPLTETALLGNVSHRAGRKLAWDPVQLKAFNCPEADEFIQHHYRKGWMLTG